ncbi:hypothetical protein ADK66_26315 [Micromonospora sp. NRRL B-16802]|uniref:hypothetical protein n=1 Tax=Micromonospora sp. NRRL B-16802 TaxID=1415541 RepID=UPI0006AE0D95|nr:hypothetical protein [Micromonospora sp. NRRL B-16802]KOX04830.1 hypothetical protein ADK66_26315 [Micromonospora sp. NRRL B-16802]
MGSRGMVLLASVVLLAGCTTGQPATPDGPGATSCGSRVETGALPDWADAGFSGDAHAPHVLGAKGDIVAVLFGHPLAQVRQDGSSNKILWVARTSTDAPSAPLAITATLDGTDTRVVREVAGGPGPSIIDLPRAGCWRLDLRWAGHTDTMTLVYAEQMP